MRGLKVEEEGSRGAGLVKIILDSKMLNYFPHHFKFMKYSETPEGAVKYT